MFAAWHLARVVKVQFSAKDFERRQHAAFQALSWYSGTTSMESKPLFMAVGLEDFDKSLSLSGQLPARPLYQNIVLAIAAAWCVNPVWHAFEVPSRAACFFPLLYPHTVCCEGC